MRSSLLEALDLMELDTPAPCPWSHVQRTPSTRAQCSHSQWSSSKLCHPTSLLPQCPVWMSITWTSTWSQSWARAAEKSWSLLSPALKWGTWASACHVLYSLSKRKGMSLYPLSQRIVSFCPSWTPVIASPQEHTRQDYALLTLPVSGLLKQGRHTGAGEPLADVTLVCKQKVVVTTPHTGIRYSCTRNVLHL